MLVLIYEVSIVARTSIAIHFSSQPVLRHQPMKLLHHLSWNGAYKTRMQPSMSFRRGCSSLFANILFFNKYTGKVTFYFWKNLLNYTFCANYGGITIVTTSLVQIRYKFIYGCVPFGDQNEQCEEVGPHDRFDILF